MARSPISCGVEDHHDRRRAPARRGGRDRARFEVVGRQRREATDRLGSSGDHSLVAHVASPADGRTSRRRAGEGCDFRNTPSLSQVTSASAAEAHPGQGDLAADVLLGHQEVDGPDAAVRPRRPGPSPSPPVSRPRCRATSASVLPVRGFSSSLRKPTSSRQLGRPSRRRSQVLPVVGRGPRISSDDALHESAGSRQPLDSRHRGPPPAPTEASPRPVRWRRRCRCTCSAVIAEPFAAAPSRSLSITRLQLRPSCRARPP